ncbi:hypothetical protein [Noviherbaspirillum aridicola]|uniref:Uncharacterized protein n=1 Tax=Noviherbaspirillum aridicola TaxID=2849687 RepID=A0ABQ4Q3Y2_9BURK|nr:hypothetical protein [Noviherbaspirillum aridicola]GIZ51897.1 hypothetical protein NCCP691_19110 [Noviherbaspirillum aridicola]
MNNQEEAASIPADEERYAQVPSDFPRPVHHGAVPGVQPKLLMTSYNSRFYIPGCTPPEIFQRWNVCEDLARQLATKAVESRAGKRSHMSETEILDQYLPRLIATKWTSEEEARWIIRRAASMLDWPVPQAALGPANRDSASSKEHKGAPRRHS